MKVIRVGLLLIVPPVLATLLVALIGLIEPTLRSILGIARATEGSPVPESVGYALFLFAFLFFHLVFLGSAWAMGKFGYKRSHTNKFIFVYSVFASLLAAVGFHA